MIGKPDVAEPAALRERLRARLERLSPADRVLVELVWSGERSMRQTARLLGRDPGSAARRYRRVWKRLTDPVVTLLMEGDLGLTAWQRRVAIEHVLCGRSMREIARGEGVSVRRVQEAIAFARGAARGHGLVRGVGVTARREA